MTKGNAEDRRHVSQSCEIVAFVLMSGIARRSRRSRQSAHVSHLQRSIDPSRETKDNDDSGVTFLT